MKDEKRLIELAEQILELEKECQLGNNISKNADKMEQLVLTLSLEELLKVNAYIEEKILTR